MSSPAHNKSQLRQQLRDTRLNIPDSQRKAAAKALFGNVEQLPEWIPSKRVAIYLSANGEIDTDPLVSDCRSANKSLYLPLIQDDSSLEFGLWSECDELTNNRFGIPEPSAATPRINANDLDMIFLPVLGWDHTGSRLGMGGGFYDRSLSGINRPLKVGLAFECQKVEQLPRDPWDVSLDFVATEIALHRCGD